MTTSTKPAQPATPLPHLTATGLFISYTGSFGAQRVAECSEEYAAAEIARRTNAYPRLLAFAGCSMAQIEAGAAPYQQINGWLKDAIAERDSLRAERAELEAALRELHAIDERKLAASEKRTYKIGHSAIQGRVERNRALLRKLGAK